MRFFDFYSNKNAWKGLMLITALLIGAGTLIYTETFLSKLRNEEVKKMEIWAESLRTSVSEEVDDAQLQLSNTVMKNNTTIPIIMIDDAGEVQSWRNIPEKFLETPEALERYRDKLMDKREPIEILFPYGETLRVYFDDSVLLSQLRVYPRVLLAVIASFLIIAYVTFSSSRRAEQDRVWTGLAKETAHQIGTPLSSLMGWLEILRTKNVDDEIIVEIEKDIDRLTRITDRFSKIGSKPQLKPTVIYEGLKDIVDYLQMRVPRKIELTLNAPNRLKKVEAPLNLPLFQWVIENLIRNGIDSIQGAGEVKVIMGEQPSYYYIEIMDTGKGIPLRQQEAIFRPGFTTKSRGWGLGLSLSRRIINDYHKGKIFVAQSELGKGSVFRIQLKKKKA